VGLLIHLIVHLIWKIAVIVLQIYLCLAAIGLLFLGVNYLFWVTNIGWYILGSLGLIIILHRTFSAPKTQQDRK
jgi:hypothetical protein